MGRETEDYKKELCKKETDAGTREYNSDVFSMLLMEKARALEIYNAINGTSYDDPELVEIIPLENKGFSLSVRNDASFVLDASLSLYEHQSTICPNMPLRSMIYFSQIIRAMVRNKNIYGGMLIKIPVPYFVELVRKNFKENGYEDLGKAINQAIDQCIRENILKDFLIENRSEVTKVMQLDYTFERQLELEREVASSQAWQQGLEQGLTKGLERGLATGMERGRLQEIFMSVQEGDYSIERGAQKVGMSLDAFKKAMAEAEQSLLVK